MCRQCIVVLVLCAMTVRPSLAADWDEFLGAGPGSGAPPLLPHTEPYPTLRLPTITTASWTFRADALAVWRTPPSSLVIFQEWDQPNREYGDTALDANQLQSPMAAGPRFTLLWESSASHGIETSFFRIQSFNAAQARPFAPVGYAIAETTTIYGNTWTALDAIDARLESSFQSFEFLLRRPMPLDWLTWTAGFRWVEWNEQLDIVTPYRFGSPPLDFVDSYQTNVSNDLYGLQVGLDAADTVLGGRATLQGVVKAGVYGNDAGQSSRYVVDDPDFPYAGAVSTDVLRTAFVGELGVTMAVPVTRRFNARIGYAAFWLAGLATASDQLAGQTLIEGEPVQGSTSTAGSVVVQGLTLGLEGSW